MKERIMGLFSQVLGGKWMQLLGCREEKHTVRSDSFEDRVVVTRNITFGASRC